MRALCLALALCCVSYAAADLAVDKLEGSDLTLAGVGGRNYIVLNAGDKVTVTTVPFTVTGIETGTTDPVRGAIFLDAETKPNKDSVHDFAADAKDYTATVKLAQADIVGASEMTYKVYTVADASSAPDTEPKGDPLATSAELTIVKIDRKAENPEKVDIVRNGCEVEFNMVGIYSKPDMRTFCGLTEEGKLLADLTNPAADEGVIAFDSITYPEDGKNTKWAPKACTDDNGDDIDGCAAWQLTEGKLNVKETKEDAAIGAACMVWVDGQDFKEYEVKQTIEVPAKHRCPTNPLKDFVANNLTDVVKYAALETATNCWTEEDSDIKAEMTCSAEGKESNSYKVFCKDGAYYTGSEEDAKAWDEDKATEWADKTCGTAGILPMSLLVGALALFASRA